MLAIIAERCDRGHTFPVREWVIVDVGLRPDLLPVVTEKTRREVRCPHCERSSMRVEPLLVLVRRDSQPPVGLMVAGRDGVPDEAPAWFMGVDWAGVDDELPIVVRTSFKGAVPAVQRELTDDLADPGPALRAVRRTLGKREATEYRRILDALRAAESTSERMRLVGAAAAAGSEDDFASLISKHPELLADETLAILDQANQLNPDPAFDIGRRLLVEARSDPRAAWRSHHERALSFGATLTSAADEWEERIRAAHADPDAVVRTATDALAFAEEINADDEFLIGVLEARAQGHLRSRTGRFAEHVSAAVRDYGQILARTHADDPRRPGRLLNAAVATVQQIGGDPTAQRRDARNMLEDALASADEAADPGLVAMLRTNLAHVLALLARGQDAGLLSEAKAQCEAALSYRSPARDPEDWAYTMINLGTVLERLAALGRDERAAARRAYADVVAHAEHISPEVVSRARLNLLILTLDERARDDEVQNVHSAQEHEDLERMARQVAFEPAASPVDRGRALRRYAALRRAADDVGEAEAALRHALDLLEGADLSELMEAARDLGSLSADERDWSTAGG